MMTMFQADTAFSVSLLALVAGMALIVWMRLHVEHTSIFCRGFAYLSVILAMAVLICVSYYTTVYWFQGYFSPQTINQNFQMKKCPMMEKCMMGKMNMDMKNMPMMNNMQCGSGNRQQMKPMMNMQGGNANMQNMQKMQGQMPMDKNSKTIPMQQPQKMQKMQKPQENPVNNAGHGVHHE